LGLFQGWAPETLIHAIAAASVFAHFSAITRGVIELPDLVYFISIIATLLAATAIIVDLKKAD
jgi:ABC-2 type transport system permease protein